MNITKQKELINFINNYFSLNKKGGRKINFNKLEVFKFSEEGFIPSLIGMSFSFKNSQESLSDFIERFEDLDYLNKKIQLAIRLSQKDGGHNKFLESMIVWVAVKAPRYLWSEMDTYRLTSKQSESTIHTIIKNSITKDDFIIDITDYEEDALNKFIKNKNNSISEVKSILPEGFLQIRMWRLDYKTIRNMILQRRNHRLPEWKVFLYKLAIQLDYPEFLPAINSQFKTLKDELHYIIRNKTLNKLDLSKGENEIVKDLFKDENKDENYNFVFNGNSIPSFEIKESFNVNNTKSIYHFLSDWIKLTDCYKNKKIKYFYIRDENLGSFVICYYIDDENPNLVKYGFSLCNPKDNFNKKIGREIAETRLYNDNKEVKFYFNKNENKKEQNKILIIIIIKQLLIDYVKILPNFGKEILLNYLIKNC